MQALIVYGTKQGQSEKIAKVIGEEIRSTGNRAEVWDVESIPAKLSLKSYDLVIVGGGVHASGYPLKLRKWVRSHATELTEKKSIFFSVCLGVLQYNPKVDAEEIKIVETFFKKTGWRPKSYVVFPGALIYSKYNWLLKRIMHSIALKAGMETDMKKDYEFTDWASVRSFAHRIVYESICPSIGH